GADVLLYVRRRLPDQSGELRQYLRGADSKRRVPHQELRIVGRDRRLRHVPWPATFSCVAHLHAAPEAHRKSVALIRRSHRSPLSPVRTSAKLAICIFAADLFLLRWYATRRA